MEINRLIFVLLIGCSSAKAVSIENMPRKLTLQKCRDFCESSGVDSFVPGYYFKGRKLCTIESNTWHCTTADTISFACTCRSLWSK